MVAPFLASSPVTAAGLILHRGSRSRATWLLLCAAKHGEWGFPKGHQDPGETLLQTALRECAEESGIALVAIEGPPLELHYRLPSGRSKRTVYFPARTACQGLILSSEHRQGGWFTADQVLHRLTHANLRSLFKASLQLPEA